MNDFMKGWLASQATEHDIIKVKRVYIDINDGNLHDGILFSQIMYWHEPSRSGNESKLTVFKDGEYWLAKQLSDWWDECRIKERTAKDSINRMVERGLLIRKYWRFNGMRMQHIRINFDEFQNRIQSLALDTEGQQTSDRTDIKRPTEQTLNVRPLTETTAQTTTKELSPTGDGTTVPEIIKAWLDASGSLDKGAYKKTGFRSVAKNIIDAGFTVQDVTDYINDVKRPNFTPSLGVIQNGIVEWAAKRKSKSGQSSNGMTEAQRLEVIFDDSKWGKPDLEGVDTRPYLIRMGLVEEFDSE